MLNANAICDVTTAKEYIKLTGTADDLLIEKIINGVSSIFENYCHCKFINVAITEVLDGAGEDKIIVDTLPISTLTSIKTRISTTWTALTLTDFVIDSKAGLILYEVDVFPEGFQNIELKYTAGYGAAIANLPSDLVLAALKQCEFFYKRDSADFSDTFDEGIVIRAPSELLSPTVEGMLAAYYKTVMK